jgi:hypothetical protein
VGLVELVTLTKVELMELTQSLEQLHLSVAVAALIKTESMVALVARVVEPLTTQRERYLELELLDKVLVVELLFCLTTVVAVAVVLLP